MSEGAQRGESSIVTADCSQTFRIFHVIVVTLICDGGYLQSSLRDWGVSAEEPVILRTVPKWEGRKLSPAAFEPEPC